MDTQLQRQSDGRLVKFADSDALGSGGEAHVYAVPSDGALVAKVYRQPTSERAAKLAAMLANPPHDPMVARGHVSIAWPVDLLQTPGGPRQVVGFLMPRAPQTRPVIDYYHPSTRRRLCPLFNYLYLHRMARNIASAMHAIHERDYVIGDVNESNILVTDTALATLVDTDSFQVRGLPHHGVYRCPVGKPEYTPPELVGAAFRDVDRRPEHDLFGLGVLIFECLMEGTHPFAGVFTGEGDPPPYEARIRAGQFPHGAKDTPYRPMPAAPPFAMLPPELRQLFLRCFEEGHRDPSARPTAQMWVTALQGVEDSLQTCRSNAQHRYGAHLGSCPWCERTARLGGRDPFPSLEQVQQGASAQGGGLQTPLPPAAGTFVGIPSLPPPLPATAPVSRAADAAAVPATVAQAAPSATRPAPSVAPRPTTPGGPPGSSSVGSAGPGGRPLATPLVPETALRPVRQFPARPVAAAAVSVVLVLTLLWAVVHSVGAAQARRRTAAQDVSEAGQLLAQARVQAETFRILGADPERAAAVLRDRMNGCAEAQKRCQEALSLDGSNRTALATRDEAGREMQQVQADTEAQSARVLTAQVIKGIAAYKGQALTDRQAAAVRDTLKSQCRDALSHCDAAIRLDPANEVAWVQRVRALRLSGNLPAARRVLEQAQALFPDDADLREQRRLIGGLT